MIDGDLEGNDVATGAAIDVLLPALAAMTHIPSKCHAQRVEHTVDSCLFQQYGSFFHLTAL
ncbi:hypothetical protein BBBOND_0202500 [Babesia bigemina]|uniref:Uncharacterized protein n=1 Tax=Babesia bigemina TaxID=5866 RepID=A0A061D3B9_BABBI|nr:hypothetical protein BBBOND_0202500 [Babesia bigemina]CDR95093.1 hypothetical protein BBBOND_0202500 [Babesia bigemina]|eukprot:XP_012767279.1 hypothetical protein BBBOND_0202500 [Babesia bigemina]